MSGGTPFRYRTFDWRDHKGLFWLAVGSAIFFGASLTSVIVFL